MKTRTPLVPLAAILATGLLAAGGALAADPAPPKPKAPKLTAELLSKGRASFEATCAACHGSAGDGNGPAGQYLNPKPRHFSKDAFKQGSSVEEIFLTLQHGVKDTPMVAYAHLPEEERWALSYYVLSFVPSKEGKAAKKLLDTLPQASPPGAAPPPASPATPAPATGTASK